MAPFASPGGRLRRRPPGARVPGEEDARKFLESGSGAAFFSEEYSYSISPLRLAEFELRRGEGKGRGPRAAGALGSPRSHLRSDSIKYLKKAFILI